MNYISNYDNFVEFKDIKDDQGNIIGSDILYFFPTLGVVIKYFSTDMYKLFLKAKYFKDAKRIFYKTISEYSDKKYDLNSIKTLGDLRNMIGKIIYDYNIKDNGNIEQYLIDSNKLDMVLSNVEKIKKEKLFLLEFENKYYLK